MTQEAHNGGGASSIWSIDGFACYVYALTFCNKSNSSLLLFTQHFNRLWRYQGDKKHVNDNVNLDVDSPTEKKRHNYCSIKSIKRLWLQCYCCLWVSSNNFIRLVISCENITCITINSLYFQIPIMVQFYIEFESTR